MGFVHQMLSEGGYTVKAGRKQNFANAKKAHYTKLPAVLGLGMFELTLSMTAAIDAALADSILVAPAPDIKPWVSHLPNSLLYVWAKYGFVSLAGDRLRLINPLTLKPLIAFLTEGDPDIDHDTHAVALGNLGEVVVWSERHGVGLLTWPLSTLQMTYMKDERPPSPDEQILADLLMLPANVFETTDPMGKPVHDRLVERLGRLSGMDIYGATPVPPEPGATPVEDYVVADALEWLEANYTEMDVDLVDWSRTPARLRTLRQPWPDRPPRHLRKVIP